MLEEREGYIWIGTFDGLNRFDPETETFTRYFNIPGDSTSLSGNTVRAIYEDEYSTLWIGTRYAGLNRFNRETGTFTRYKNIPGDETSLSNNQLVRAIFEDSRGNFWVGTGQDGMHTMDRATGTFTHYPYDPVRPNQPSMPHLRHGSENFDPIASDFPGLSFVHEDKSNRLWIGGCGGGLDIFDPDAGQIDHYEATLDDPSSRGLNTIWAIYESHDGAIWLGSWLGLYRAEPSLTGYTSNGPDPINPDSLSNGNVWVISEGNNGVIYVPTWGGGLNLFDTETGTFSTIDHDPDDSTSISTDNVATAIEDQSGRLWVGTIDGGINRRLDKEVGTFQRYRYDPGDSLSLSGDTAYPYEDSRGTIWVGTFGGGLSRLLDPETGTFKRYSSHPDDPSSISSNHSKWWYEDKSLRMWIGTSSGLNRYNRDTDNFTRFLPGVFTTTIFEDTSGRFWIGTFGDGLMLLDRETGGRTRFTTDDGLPSNNVAGIVEDDRGILWLSTYEGSWMSPEKGRITRYDPETESFTSFGPEDGLPEIGFVYRSVMERSDGKIMFGGIGGLLTIDSDVFGADVSPAAPLVALTELRIFNEPVKPGVESPLNNQLYLTNKIVLGHRENDLTIEYVGLLYRNPGEMRYQYMLENHDRGWVEARTQRSARYSGLAPGDYIFRIRAMSGKGVWSEEDGVIGITILPPWWRTVWAHTLWALLLVGAVVGAYRVQHARIVRKEREKAEMERTRLRAEAAELQAKASDAQARTLEVENERNRLEVEKARELEKAYNKLTTTQAQLIQSEKMASLGQLTAGIAHEIKNPLNFVNNFSEVNEELTRELSQELLNNKNTRVEEILDDLEDIIGGIRVNSVHITKHGKRADSIVNNMMEHAREGGGQRLHVGLNPFVEENISLSHNSMLAQHPDLDVEIVRDLDEAIGNVEMSPQEMGRALINVLNNAFDAVIRKKETTGAAYEPIVKIETRQVNGGVEIRIEDNGPGIADDIKEKIFEPFFTTKPTGSGTGLGLSLAYDIVTQGHGGTMTVESEEGEGATFVIKLPT